MQVDAHWGTTVDEVADRVFRISTPVPPVGFPGGFSFNQYLLLDDEPLLFHTGLRRLSGVIREAIARVMPVETLRFIAFSHLEADECGALNDLLAVAPLAVPVCSEIAAEVSMNDLADRRPLALADGQYLPIGSRSVQWIDAPHMPHAWECGYLFEVTDRVLLCGDLFTQGGHRLPPVTESEVLSSSEAFRRDSDYFSHTRNARGLLERLAETNPTLLACMHGSAYRGDGAALLRALAEALDPTSLPLSP